MSSAIGKASQESDRDLREQLVGVLLYTLLPESAFNPYVLVLGNEYLLKTLREGTPDRHCLSTDCICGPRTQMLGSFQNPARNLSDDVINCWFEARWGFLSDVVRNFIESVPNG